MSPSAFGFAQYGFAQPLYSHLLLLHGILFILSLLLSLQFSLSLHSGLVLIDKVVVDGALWLPRGHVGRKALPQNLVIDDLLGALMFALAPDKQQTNDR